jgi:hypothetical protein
MMCQYRTSWSPTNQFPGNAHTSWSPANQRWGNAESSWSPSNGKWTVHDLRNPIWRVGVLCAATDWRLRWGFRLGCLGDPILVLLWKFDAQIERKKERKNYFEILMHPIRKKGKEWIFRDSGPGSEFFQFIFF